MIPFVQCAATVRRWSFRAVLIGLAFGQTSLLAQEGYALKKIEFTGNTAFSDKALQEVLTLHAKSRLEKLLFWRPDPRHSENMLNQDLARLQQFYMREGFIDARVDSVIVRANDDKRAVTLNIVIHEGEPLRLRGVEHELVTGEKSEPQRAQRIFAALKPKLKLQPGMRYRDQALLAAREAIFSAFDNGGYPYVRITPELALSDDRRSVDVSLRIEIGPLCLFGEVQVVGNEKIPATLIKKHLAFERGKEYSLNAILQTQRQVYQLGVFQFATVKVLLEEAESNILPVQIRVKEAPRLSMKVGAGWGKEDRVRAFVDIRKIGVFGGARKATLFLKHSRLEPVRVNLGITQPAFLSWRNRFTLNPFYRIENEISYNVKRLGTNFLLQRRMGNYWDAYLNYNLEKNDLTTSTALRDETLDSLQVSLYNKSSLTIGTVLDNSGPIFNPSRGTFRAATLTLAGLGRFSDVHFVRLLLEFRQYLDLGRGILLAYRLKFGGMQPIQPSTFTPIEERFYSGGASSVRGWPRSLLGPLSSDGKPTGGNSLLEGSVEIRYPIWRILSGVTFIDMGNVWRGAWLYKFNDLGYALGAGLRMQTPIGPIRFDIGLPLNKRVTTVLSPEGQPLEYSVPALQFHLSVGHAF